MLLFLCSAVVYLGFVLIYGLCLVEYHSPLHLFLCLAFLFSGLASKAFLLSSSKWGLLFFCKPAKWGFGIFL